MVQLRHCQTGESSLVSSTFRPAGDSQYSRWSERRFCGAEDHSLPSDPGEPRPGSPGILHRGPLPAIGTPEGVLWQACGIFSGLNAETVVYTTS